MADALGMIETKSFIAMVEALDAMAKAAKILHITTLKLAYKEETYRIEYRIYR